MGSFGEFEKLQMPLTFLQEPRPDLVHVGLVLLSSDHSLEMEWSKLLSDQVLTFNSRVHHNGLLDAHDLSQISQGIVDTTNLIATGLEMDVMAFACTSASIVIGETKISNLLTHNRKNIPSTNPWTAAKTAFNYLKEHPRCDGNIGVVGFCFGGWISNMMAVRVPELKAAVPFYRTTKGGRRTSN